MKSRKEHPNSTQRTILAEEYIKKYPKLGNRTIARILHEDYPDIFKSIENGRDSVRLLKGSKGNKERNKTPQLPRYLTNEDVENHEDWTEPFVIHEKRIGVMGDLQGIFADEIATNLVIDRFKEEGIKVILINGDLIDNYWLSRFGKSRRYRNFLEELHTTRSFLEKLSKDFKIYYKYGNHEKRFDDYVLTYASEFEGIITLQDQLKLAENKIEYIGHLKQINFGDLVIMHGHEKPGKFSPQQIGKSIIKWWQSYTGKLEVKVMVSHHHIMDVYSERNLDGTISYGYAVGCLCKRMSYSPYGRMQQGGAICENVNGATTVNNFEV
jgi:hypothetical protein